MAEPEVTPRSAPPYHRHGMYLLENYSSEEDSDVIVKPACNNEIVKTSNAQQRFITKAGSAKKHAVTSDSKEKGISESMNNSVNETSPRRFSKIDRKKDIELYCVKCDNISRPTIVRKREMCALCNTSLIYQCKICKKQYIHKTSIYRHLKNECINVAHKYKCSQCDYKTKQKANLRRHEERKHSIKKCTRCGEIFNDVHSLRKHQLHKCSNKIMHNCNHCSYKTIFKTQLMKHIRLEYNSRYTCSQCGEKYMNLKSFNNHQKYDCGSEIRYECSHCSYSTNFKQYLEGHIRRKHSEIFLVGDSL